MWPLIVDNRPSKFVTCGPECWLTWYLKQGCQVVIVSWLIDSMSGTRLLSRAGRTEKSPNRNGTMVHSCKYKTFYYVCSNKDSLYVDRWSLESRDKHGHVVSRWLDSQEHGLWRKLVRLQAWTFSAVGRNGSELKHFRWFARMVESRNVIGRNVFHREQVQLWASTWLAFLYRVTCDYMGLVRASMSALVKSLHVFSIQIGSTAIRQDHYELAQAHFSCGLEWDWSLLLDWLRLCGITDS